MKKYLLIFLVLLSINSAKAQDKIDPDAAGRVGAAVGAAVGGVISLADMVIQMSRLQELLELKAVQQVLDKYPFLTEFELKTLSLKGVKTKDLSNVSVITFEITDLNSADRFVLFAFTSEGWINSYGIDFNRLVWKNFSKIEWNALMQQYIYTASKINLSM